MDNLKGLDKVESLTKKYSESYGKLSNKVKELNDDIAQIKKKHLLAIKKYAESVQQDAVELTSALCENKECFESPKTFIFHGIKVGFQKQPGTITYDEAVTIKLIKKHFKKVLKLYVETTEKIIKAALKKLPVTDLMKLGCEVTDSKDAVLIKATEGEIEKFVNQLISEDNDSQLKLVHSVA